MTTTRAVLLAPRIGSHLASPEALKAMNVAMEQLTREGVELVGIMDPADFMTALQMLLDGKIERVVATRPDHIPGVRFLGDEAWFRPGVMGTADFPAIRERRARMLARPADGASTDNPQPVAPQTLPPGADERTPARRASRLPARPGEAFWRDGAVADAQQRSQRVKRA